jgi:hypothetical protein
VKDRGEIEVALKEWGVICEAVLAGEQAILLRKGGVHEEEGPGRFALRHDRFALFPAWEHQRADWVKARWAKRCAEQVSAWGGREPERVPIEGGAEVAGVWAVPSRAAFDGLDDLHAWRAPYVDMRFDYKPDRPLYLVLLRAWRLAEPTSIAMNDRYWGCKSWIDLDAPDALATTGSLAVLDDEAIEATRRRIDEAFGVPA